MALLDKSKKQTYPAWFYILAILAVVGIALSIYRLIVGLGPTTNMSDHYPWGIWITVDLFLIPVAGAAFTISLINYFYGREDYHAIVRPAVLAGVLGYLIVGVLLFLDIGRWHQFYNILLPPLNVHSFLEEISLCVTLYTLILIIEILPVFLEKRGIKTPIRWINRSIFIIAGAGIILSTLHQSSLGSLFLLMPYKLHPLWWTPALPVLFFLQATYTGLGTMAIVLTFVWRSRRAPADRKLMQRIGQAMGINLVLYLAVKGGDWMGAGEIPLLLRPDLLGIFAWLEMIIGVIIPLWILFSRLIKHSRGPFWAGVFALMGTFINRLIITWVGLAEPSPVTYIPSLIEVLITVGLLATGFLIYVFMVRQFDLFPEQLEAH
jgi:Ni/Fe-hydrogenase subunit HybB-like protein